MRLWLKQARESKALTMGAMAKDIGISEGYYCLIEQGKRQKNMDLTLVAKISSILSIPLADILNAESERKAIDTEE